MQRSCKFLRREYKVTVYRTIIEPHFTYCASIIFLCTLTDTNKLQTLQNRAMKSILKKPRDTRTKELLDELNWLSVYQSCVYFTLILIFKIKHNLLPPYLATNLKLRSEMHGRDLRNKNDFNLPKYSKACTQNNLYFRGVIMYNETTNEMKNCQSLSIYKKLCYEYMKTKPIRKKIVNM